MKRLAMFAAGMAVGFVLGLHEATMEQQFAEAMDRQHDRAEMDRARAGWLERRAEAGDLTA